MLPLCWSRICLVFLLHPGVSENKAVFYHSHIRTLEILLAKKKATPERKSFMKRTVNYFCSKVLFMCFLSKLSSNDGKKPAMQATLCNCCKGRTATCITLINWYILLFNNVFNSNWMLLLNLSLVSKCPSEVQSFWCFLASAYCPCPFSPPKETLFPVLAAQSSLFSPPKLFHMQWKTSTNQSADGVIALSAISQNQNLAYYPSIRMQGKHSYISLVNILKYLKD